MEKHLRQVRPGVFLNPANPRFETTLWRLSGDRPDNPLYEAYVYERSGELGRAKQIYLRLLRHRESSEVHKRLANISTLPEALSMARRYVKSYYTGESAALTVAKIYYRRVLAVDGQNCEAADFFDGQLYEVPLKGNADSGREKWIMRLLCAILVALLVALCIVVLLIVREQHVAIPPYSNTGTTNNMVANVPSTQTRKPPFSVISTRPSQRNTLPYVSQLNLGRSLPGATLSSPAGYAINAIRTAFLEYEVTHRWNPPASLTWLRQEVSPYVWNAA